MNQPNLGGRFFEPNSSRYRVLGGALHSTSAVRFVGFAAAAALAFNCLSVGFQFALPQQGELIRAVCVIVAVLMFVVGALCITLLFYGAVTDSAALLMPYLILQGVAILAFLLGAIWGVVLIVAGDDFIPGTKHDDTITWIGAFYTAAYIFAIVTGVVCFSVVRTAQTFYREKP